MSDPLSITTGVITLVASSIKSVQAIQTWYGKYKIADLSLASTRTECAAIRVALLQIQELLVQNNSKSKKGESDSFIVHALEEYEGVLGSCSITFSVLNERLTELNQEKVDKNNEGTFKSKLKLVWNDAEMDVLRQNIRGQAAAINLLLSAFQAESSAKTYQLLKERKNRTILETVSSDTQTLLSKSHRARTISQRVDADDDESTGSVIGDEVFDFDDIVINSAAYRRAYHSYTTRAQARPKPDLNDEKDKKKENSSINLPDGLVFHNVDYFDLKCARLFQHVENWVLRFSKASDGKRCRPIGSIRDEKLADRFDDTILDGSDVDSFLADRIKRRDVFMSVVMTCIWEFVFTRYLFGLSREQRQRLKALERELAQVGPQATVMQWRAITFSLLAKRPGSAQQRTLDTTSVADEIYRALSILLPPPDRREQELRRWLHKVIEAAVDLSIDMRTQRAEYMMLPPLVPQYDSDGNISRKVHFNASLMNERSGATTSNNEELEEQQAIVQMILFPLVVQKGNDEGVGDEEIVVFPAQAIVSQPWKDKTVRGLDPNQIPAASRSSVSVPSTIDADSMI